MKPDDRSKLIVRTGIVGILTNITLAFFKMLVGMFSNSIAVTLDAVNNLTDSISSVITIIGIKLAAKPADREHPLGHGRIEYLSAILIAGIIFFAGAVSLYESVMKIINPSETTYTSFTLFVIVVAVFTKIWLGTYTRKKGKETSSDSLVASGSDAMFDALVSSATLLSAVIQLTSGYNLDAYFGAGIAVIIIKAGYEMLRDTLDNILGKRADADLAKGIREDIEKMDYVVGVYDIFLDNYGPEKIIGSVHLEVPDNLNAVEIDELCRKVTAVIFKKYYIILTCGIYAVPNPESKWYPIFLEIRKVVMSHEGVLQMHGFHADEKNNTIFFDVVRDFGIKNTDIWVTQLTEKVKELYPQYKYSIIVDLDYVD